MPDLLLQRRRAPGLFVQAPQASRSLLWSLNQLVAVAHAPAELAAAVWALSRLPVLAP